jgi:uncharacterized cupin superfamily protein
MKKITIEQAPTRFGSMYPEPFDVPCRSRKRWRLGAAAGLAGFGVNLCRLPPGTWSSQRHWHSHDDEFIYVVEGEVVLVTDAGEEVLKSGDCAGFKASEPDGHCLQNRSDREAVVLEVGTNNSDGVAEYPDIDLRVVASQYVHKDGRSYPTAPRRFLKGPR